MNVPALARGRHRRDGQSREPQRSGRASDRGRRSDAALPAPCSPDFRPMKNAISKLKALLRNPPIETLKLPGTGSAPCSKSSPPKECANFFAAAMSPARCFLVCNTANKAVSLTGLRILFRMRSFRESSHGDVNESVNLRRFLSGHCKDSEHKTSRTSQEGGDHKRAERCSYPVPQPRLN